MSTNRDDALCRRLCCPRNGPHREGECGQPPPTKDPVMQAEEAAFGPQLDHPGDPS